MKRVFLTSFLFIIVLDGFSIDNDLKLLKSITSKLISSIDTFPRSKKPIDINKIQIAKVNAYAWPKCPHSSHENYTIQVNSGLMTFFNRDEDYIAIVLAHELSHILLNHVKECDRDNQNYRYIDREQEYDADLLGLKIYLNAGYSYSKAIDAYKKMKFELGDNSSFETQEKGIEHPTITNRLERIDNHHQGLWRTMACFENGSYFLEMQAYDIAIILFKQVIKEFPNCYEAYANIGYARLMQYFDGFSQEDIKGFHVGQLAMGGFYKRPESLISKIKGFDEDKWWEAIGYFNKSLAIKENQPLVTTYLGIAYFFDPRQLSISKAFDLLSFVTDAIKNDTILDRYTKAVLYNNIAALGINHEDNFKTNINDLLASASNTTNRYNSNAFKQEGIQLTGTGSIADIVIFNQCYYKFRKGDTTEMNHKVYELFLEKFLEKNSLNVHVWWDNAYALYCEVCKLNRHAPKGISVLRQNENILHHRSINHVLINDSSAIYLSQNIVDVNMILGKPDSIILSKERKLYSLVYPKYNIKVVLNDNEVISIVVRENSSAKIVMDGDPKVILQMDEQLPSEKIPDFSLNRPYKISNDLKAYFFDTYGISVLLTDKQIVKEIRITTEPYSSNK
jgi:tetratricopeptide (TPR) repeat protein